jgi:hypothetical protein
VKSVKRLNKLLIANASWPKKFRGPLTDLHFKGYADDYSTAMESEKGRKLFVAASRSVDVEARIRPLLLLADSIIFNTSDYDPEPKITIFPVPDKLKNPALGVTSVWDGKRERFPSTYEMSIMALAKSDRVAGTGPCEMLGYNWEQPQHTWQRTEFTRTSDTMDGFGKHHHVAFGFCYQYPDGLYDWLFGEARQLLQQGRIAFAPFVRAGEEMSVEPILKAELLGGTLIVDGRLHLANARIHPLEDVKVPYLDQAPLPLLAKIIEDEAESLRAFRKVVDRCIEDISTLTEPHEIDRELKRLKRDLVEDEMSKVETVCRKALRMRVIASSGASLATGALTMAGIEGLAIPSMITAGAAAGITIANQFWQAYEEKRNARRNPMYFAWRLKTKLGI